jgi:hypothetical protein
MIQLHCQPCHHHVLQGTNDSENNVVLGKTTSKTEPLRRVFPLLFNIKYLNYEDISKHNKTVHTVALEVLEQPKQLTTHLTLNACICVKEAFNIGAAF